MTASARYTDDNRGGVFNRAKCLNDADRNAMYTVEQK